MNRPIGESIRLASLAAGILAAASAFVFSVPRPMQFAGTPVVSVTITERDVTASNKKIEMAAGALISMWSGDFAKLGERFAQPGLVRYRGATMPVIPIRS